MKLIAGAAVSGAQRHRANQSKTLDDFDDPDPDLANAWLLSATGI